MCHRVPLSYRNLKIQGMAPELFIHFMGGCKRQEIDYLNYLGMLCTSLIMIMQPRTVERLINCICWNHVSTVLEGKETAAAKPVPESSSTYIVTKRGNMCICGNWVAVEKESEGQEDK